MNLNGFTSMVGRVGFEPTITGARDRYLEPVLSTFDQGIPAARRTGPPPLEGTTPDAIEDKPFSGSQYGLT